MKVLIISHNPLSLQNNMGKTLLSLFSGFSAEELCQMYIYPSLPDGAWCNSFYRVTDKDVLKSLTHFSLPGGELETSQIQNSNQPYENPEDQDFYKNRKNKSAVRRILRDVMWRFSRWDHAGLARWLEKEKPECIFVAPGVAKFLYNFALRISRKLQIPVVTYICDEYYFVKRPAQMLDRLRLKLLKNKMEALISVSDHLVVISKELAEDYGHHFGVPASVLMTGAERNPDGRIRTARAPQNITYFGNVRCNRYVNLAQIGQVLDKINEAKGTAYCLRIYTGEQDPQILDMLRRASSVDLKGFVSGAALEQAMQEADILLHTEAFDEASMDFTKHSISTKIADSLASGIPLLAYGPDCLSSMKYLKENQCAMMANAPEELEQTIVRAFFEESTRNRVAENGLLCARQYHDRSVNSDRLRKILECCMRK